MEIHTCTKDLLSILPMISDSCWRCTMSHSASQYTTCTTRSIKNPNLHPKISRKSRLINTAMSVSSLLSAEHVYLGAGAANFTHWLSALTLKLWKFPSHHLICFLLSPNLVAWEDMQHKALLSTATSYDQKHYQNGSRFKENTGI